MSPMHHKAHPPSAAVIHHVSINFRIVARGGWGEGG